MDIGKKLIYNMTTCYQFYFTNILVHSWFQTFAVFWMLYAFYLVIPWHLNFICRRFRTHYLFHPHRQVGACRMNKQSVLASLIHRAKALCDEDSLIQELEFLTTVFKANGYNPQQIRAMEPATRTAKTIDKPTSTAYIPYTQTTYGRLNRMLAKHNIKVSPYHLENYPATFHQSRIHWD
jgi:hypothetical protein